MKKIKKGFIYVLLAILASFCLCFATACDEEESGGGSNTPAEYVLIYNLQGNNAQPVSISLVGGSFAFKAPNRAGLVFKGLFDENDMMIVNEQGVCLVQVQSGLKLYARWEKMECVLLFDAGEFGTISEESKTLEYESYVTQYPTPTPVAGKVFVGWLNGETLVTDEDGFVVEGKEDLNSENYTFTDNSKIQFVAQYETQKFTYTFDYQDENFENKEGVVEYGATYATIRAEFPELTDTGTREMVGWSKDENALDAPEDDEAILSDVTLYAIWKDYKTFYFYEDEGVSATPVKMYLGDTGALFQPTEKYGYEFIGWYTTAHFSGLPVQSIGYYSSHDTYYAKWEMVTYTLTFNADNGETYDSVKYTIQDYKELPTPEKENYTFVGWCMKEDLSDTPRTVIAVGSYGGGTMYAKYKGIDRMVRFFTEGGTLSVETAVAEYGAKYTLAVPTFEGFAFAGWYDGNGENAKKLTDSKGASLGVWTSLAEETNVYAKYTKKYYINVELRDKDNLSASVGATVAVEEYYVSGENASFAVTVAEGYRFDGIYNDNDARVTAETTYTFLMPASDCTFYVKVYPETYTLTLNPNGGTLEDSAPVTITYGEEFTLPVPYKTGYNFQGWAFNDELCTDGNGESISTTIVKSNGILEAQYEKNADFENYTVIKTASDLLKIAENPSGTYALGANISLSGYNWTSIDFAGSFDGSGFKISGLKTPLFNVLTGTVKNLKVEVNIEEKNEGGCKALGGFTREANGNALIENITVYGKINVNGNYDLGGVVGATHSGTPIIKNCENNATIISENNEHYTGGVIGALHVIGGDVYGCENYGAVSSKNVAGICAWIKSAMTFKECVNYGTVTGTELAGGITAYLGGKATLNACGSYATVNGNGGATGKYSAQTNVTYVNLKPIEIKTADDLQMLKNCIAQETFVLKKDVDMNGLEWVPFDFSATFDGAGHKIKNFSLSKADGGVGFFNALSGTVKNLKFENVNIECTSDSECPVGVVCLEAQKGALIQRVEVLSGSVKGKFGCVGGIVGVSRGLVEGCKNYATVTATAVTESNGATGGIVGWMPNEGGEIRDCENHGAVQGTYKVGGVVGAISFNGNCANRNLVNNARVTGTADYVGGVIGLWSASGNLTAEGALKNTGAVTGANYVGGVVGRLYNTVSSNSTYTMKLRNYTNSGMVAGTHCVGGVFGWLKADNTWSPVINVYVSEMKNTANVTATLDEAGGLAGYVFVENGTSTFSGVSSGTIKAETEVGGIVGWYDNGTLADCSNAGTTVIATKYSTDSNGVKYAYVGGYAGHATRVVNCHNATNISYTAGGIYVGGITGRANGEFVNCSNSGDVTAVTSDYVGGLAGHVYAGGNQTMKNLKNSGVVKGANYVGGVFGNMHNEYGSSTNCTMTYTDVGNSGEIIATGNYVGGLFGRLYANNTYAQTLKIVGTEWKNTGDVTGKTYVGGFVGYTHSDNGDSQISGESGADIKAEAKIGGLVGWSDNVRLVDCSNAGSTITATKYEMDSNGKYYAYLGGYAGKGYAFVNCKNDVNVTYAEKGVYVGGITGYANNAFTDCENTGNITAVASDYVGGIAGHVGFGGTITYTELVNSGVVKGANYVGGVFGNMNNEYGSSTNCTMTYTDVGNSGEIIATGNYVGGLFGRLYANNTYAQTLKIVGTEWKNTGDVTGKTYVGGFVGYTHSDNGDSQISGESGADIKAEAKIGGLVGWSDNVRLVDCSNAGSTITATKYDLDTNTTTYYAYVGGYAGKGDAFVNCHNASNISYYQRGIYVGGIAGKVDDKLENCSNAGTIRAESSDYVGGLVGYAEYGGYTFTYADLKNSGGVAGVQYVGGLFGKIYSYTGASATYTISFQTVENSGWVSATSNYVGGLVGHFYTYNHYGSYANVITVMEAKNTGDVKGVDARYVGGLFGYAYGESTNSKILTSSSSGKVTGGCYIGGFAGWLENIVVQDCTNAGCTVKATSTLVDGSTYYAYVGGFAGRGYSFVSCTNTVDITYDKGGDYVGGLAGWINGALSDCTNEGDVLAEHANYVGGLVGYAGHGSNVTHTGLANKGDVKGNVYVGGIFGRIHGELGASGAYKINLSVVVNEGSVTGLGGYVGGIAGFLYANNTYGSGNVFSAVMTDIENDGAIEGYSASYTGAFFGEFWTEASSPLTEAVSAGSVNNGTNALAGTQYNLNVVQ